MENKSLDFYKKRRVEKNKKRQKRQIQQFLLFASFLLFATAAAFALISKPTIAKVKSTTLPLTQGFNRSNTLMATQGSLKLLLPITQNKLTSIGFHEAFSPQSLSLKPIGLEINTKKVKDLKSLLKLKRESNSLIYSLMWRGGRNGPLNSSIDVGSKAGTINYSPVGGRVVEIRKYKLYGRYPDTEVHILPEGFRDRHLVIIHINDIKVNVGDKVIAGMTPIGRTRYLSRFFKQQLADYSKEDGNHVHYQVNKLVNGKCRQERK